MGSQSKRLIELATATQSSSIPIAMTRKDEGTTLILEETTSIIEDDMTNLGNATSTISVVPNENVDPEVFNRRRCDSSSSSSSSSSDTSSSSSDSSLDKSSKTFFEDSDDSVIDPNFELVEARYRNQSASNTDEEEVNVSSSNHDNILREIPTPDHVMSQNNMQVPQMMLTQNEPCGVSATHQESTDPHCSPNKTGKKRRRKEGNWKKNIAKRLRNSGKAYVSLKTKKNLPERKLKPPCGESCKFKCSLNVTEEHRQQLLTEYWNLGDIEKQRSFIANSMETVVPKHRYIKVDSQGNIAPTRENNNSYFLILYL